MTRRLGLYYAVVGLIAAAVLVTGFTLGSEKDHAPNFAAVWTTAPGPADACLGQVFQVRQSGSYAAIKPIAGDKPSGKLDIDHGRISGRVDCADGTKADLDGTVAGTSRRLSLTLDGRPVQAADTGRAVPQAGQLTKPPRSLEGEYKTTPGSACLGSSLAIEEAGDGFAIEAGSGQEIGELAYVEDKGAVTGTATCLVGPAVKLTGTAIDRTINLTFGPTGPAGTGAPQVPASQVSLQRTRETEDLFASFFLAVMIVILAAQAGGWLMARAGQPRVMGEVLSGILLGPTLLGALSPRLEAALFPSDVVPYISVVAQLGLVFYMFLIGLELDLSSLKGRIAQTAAISNTGVVVPMALGVIAAVPLYELIGTSKAFTPFALFMGVSMSITAFPVLARILVERRMIDKPLGTLALASAAIDDVTAWALIALASATVGGSTGNGPVETILLTVAFALVMAFAIRPLVGRVAVAFGETGRLPAIWFAAIIAGILASAYATEKIGVAIIFGAFVFGTIMPRHTGLSEDISRRMESFIAIVLLPLFFAATGLKTNMLLIDRGSLVLITIGLSLLAITAKLGGTMLAARVTGLGWRDSAVLGSLMNTRGLTELIVLSLALEKGVISEALFASLVIMALVTTFMAGPLLKLLDPSNALGASADDAFDEALEASDLEATPERKILVAPETVGGLAPLLAIAEPMARSEPERELILLNLLAPTPGTDIRGGLQSERARLAVATRELRSVRGDLAGRGLHARGAALTSRHPGEDLTKIAEREQVDLVLLDGRRTLAGRSILGGATRGVLEHASSDVVVMVSSETQVLPPPPGAPVVVPFGGAAHDWAALELGAWLSTSLGAPLRLLGSQGDDGEDASRLLANATLMLQSFLRIEAEPVIVESGSKGILAGSQDGGLLVVGLSDRWREEGLGDLRTRLAREASLPLLFVRRGTRAGVLAGRDDVTRFAWSRAGSVG